LNETEIFLKACKKYNVELKLVDGAIAVLGDSKHAQNARRSLDSSKELTAGVIEFLRKQTAQEQAQAFKPEEQSQPQSEPHVYTYEEVTANYHKAYMESKRRLALDVNTSPYSPFFVDGVTDKVAGYKWTAELAKLRERQALQAKDI